MLAAAEWSPPAQIAAWLACLAFLVTLGNQAFRFWGFLSGRPSVPQPLEVVAHKPCAHAEDFDEHVERNRHAHNEMFQKHRELEGKLREEHRREIDALRSEITAVKTDLAALSSTTEAQNEQLREIRGDIKQLLGRHA
jgi:chromosome segregation ATPase